MSLWQVSQEISRRLACIFLRDPQGRRPVHGGLSKFQTGWTGLLAQLLQIYGSVTDFEAAVAAVASRQEKRRSDASRGQKEKRVRGK